MNKRPWRWRQRIALGCAVGALGAAVALSAQAATIVWGGGDGTFSTAANWVGGAAPGSSDTASFDGFIPLPTVGMTASASANGSGDVPSNALDGRTTTRWSSGAFQTGSEWFKLDLGASMTFSRIVLDCGAAEPSDYPRGYSVTVSTDNITYTSAVATGAASGQLTTINFTAQTARYIKISQTGSSGSNWWGIAEYTVYGPSAWVPLSTSGWGVTASRSSSTETVSKSIDGDRSTRWSTGAAMTTSDWYKVNMGSSKTFSRVEWDGNPATWSCDYPPSWTLAVSTNDSTYTTVATGTSSVNLTNVIFAAQTAQYIKISSNATACGGGSWWGIAEFRVFTPTQSTQLSRNSWSASASASDGASPVGNAIDGNTGTRWATGAAQTNGQWFMVDMKQSLSIDAITMDAYGNTSDYPNAWKLETSTDNLSWSTVTAAQAGSAEYIHYQFAPRTARYVRVTQTGSWSNWWSIAEFYVYGTPVNASISSSATVSGINLAGSATLTQASGNTLTTSGDFTQSAGTFTGGNSQISVGGDFNLSGGTFTSTSGVMVVIGAFNATGGTFTHHSGRVLLASTSDQPFATNGVTFYDLAVNDGLVGYWKLDDGTTPVVDSSGYAQSGTLSNTPTWGAGPTLNFTNANSMTLNGTNQYARISRTTALEPTAVTVCAWVKPNGTQPQWAKIVSKTYGNAGPSPYGTYELQLNPGGTDSTIVSFATGTTGPSSTGIWSASGAAPNGSWTHVCGVYDPSASAPQKRVYTNGVSAGTATLTGALLYDTTSTGDLYIGQAGANANYLKGSVDEVRVYSRALAADEIYALYAGNQPGTSVAIQTMTGSPTIANDLTLAAGTLAAGSNNLTVGGSWKNYGGIFTGTGTVTMNSTGAEVIRSAGQPFKNLTLNGSGATWTLEDWLKVTSSLTMTTGALSAGSNAIHVSNTNKTSGTFTAGTGTVVIDGTADVTQSTGFSFNNLRIEAPDETGLVGYWKFDEGQGNTSVDSSGTGNNATLNGAVNWPTSLTTTGLPSAIGFDNHAAVTFDGSTTYGVLGTTSLPAANHAQSISVWVNLGTNGTGADRYMVSMWNGTTSGVSLGLINTSGKLTVWKWGATALIQTTAPSTGTWHHVAYTFDGTTHNLYVDGTAVTPTTTAPNTLTPTNLQIGAYNSGPSYVGSLDDLRIYNVALTATQVKNLYAGRYSGVGSNTTVTLGANSSASGTLAIDGGTLSTSTFTMNASSASNAVQVGSGATYTVGSATQTMSGGLTVNDSGTLNLNTANGAVALGNASTFTMNGTLNASSTSAAIQAVTGGKYFFSIGTTPTSRPTLNITGLQIKDTGSNGMFINTDYSSVTTFTRFDNIAFSRGYSTAANNYNLRIHASSLYLTANGCTFDNGVSATVANNVKLEGNGTADGETRIMFGNATCASNQSSCEAYDADDDSTNDGVGDNPSTDGAVIQWINGAQADVSGSIEGFPTAAFDWSSFTYYSTYVTYHDVNGGTADRVYVRASDGSSDNYYWDTPSNVDLIGTPRWDTVSGTHYVYVATTSGNLYRLVDNGTNSLTPDTASPWNGSNNPFNCSCTIATPLAQDTGNVYFGGVASATYKFWTVSKTSTTRQPTGSPHATGATTSNAAPAIYTSGDTYAFLGQAGRVTKFDITTQSVTGDNTNPGSSNPVTGRISIINGAVYAGDDNGYMWSLDPGTNFAASSGTYKNFGYHDATNHATCGGVCQVKSHYVDPQYTHVIYGDQDGHLYVLDSTGVGYKPSSTTLYPWRPGSSSEAFATAPLYRNGVIVIGATDGFLYIVDQNKDNTTPALIQTYRFGASGTAVSGVAYDSQSGNYMISTANATNKDGKLYYISASSDPTPSFP